MSDELISLFYSGADAVLANSGHEPFGLVGLEVMAAGGIAFVGSTGEDYAVPMLNSVVLDTDDPAEIGIALDFLRHRPEVVQRLRSDAQETARASPENVVVDTLLGKLYVSLRQLVTPAEEAAEATAAAPLQDPQEVPGPQENPARGPRPRVAGLWRRVGSAHVGRSADAPTSRRPPRRTGGDGG